MPHGIRHVQNVDEIIKQFGNLSDTVSNFGSNAVDVIADALRYRPFPYEPDPEVPPALVAAVQAAENGDLPPLPTDTSAFDNAMLAGQDVGTAVGTATGAAMSGITNYLDVSAQFGEQEMVDFIANDMQGKAQTAAREIMTTHPELGLIDTALSPEAFAGGPVYNFKRGAGKQVVSPTEQFQLAEAENAQFTKTVYDQFAETYGVDPELIKMYVGREKEIEVEEIKLQVDLEREISGTPKDKKGDGFWKTLDDGSKEWVPAGGEPLMVKMLQPGQVYAFLQAAMKGIAWEPTNIVSPYAGTVFTIEGASSIAVQHLVDYYESEPNNALHPPDKPSGWSIENYAQWQVKDWGGRFGEDPEPPTGVQHPLKMRPEDSLRGLISQLDQGYRGGGTPENISLWGKTEKDYITSPWARHLVNTRSRIMSESPQEQHLYAAKNTLGSYADTAAGEASIGKEFRNNMGRFMLTVAMEGGWNPVQNTEDTMYYDWEVDNLSKGTRGGPLSKEEARIMAKNWKLIVAASKDQRLLMAKVRTKPEDLTRAEMIAANPSLEMAAAVAMNGGGEADLGPRAQQKMIAFDRIVNNHSKTQSLLSQYEQTGLSYGLSRLRGSRWETGERKEPEGVQHGVVRV